jgi:predicted Zn-dependent peptidase
MKRKSDFNLFRPNFIFTLFSIHKQNHIQMKLIRILILVVFCFATNLHYSQNKAKPVSDAPVQPKLNYETAQNDPYKTRIYTLSNGMKVYMSVYKDAPRIQTMIAVKSGSKDDPADATGLAHYLEHMVFKGTDKYGTKDFVKENEQIQKIEKLFELYRKTKDEPARKRLYHAIDSISGVASRYAIANEYDKMMAAIGAEGTNAFTSFDETVYINDIPNNQISNWLKIEQERFRKPVLRLFHTELEAVYEEKNRSLDSDNDKAWEGIMAELFKKHSYGTQTTIGTIEHLKNPSMKEIMKYYNKNYVPNNMAIIMSGDLDPDKTIIEIEKTFGKFPAKPVEPYKFEKEEPITQKRIVEVVGPEADNMAMAFRFGGASSRDADMISIINLLLSNGRAGLLDINLNQAQKVISSGSFVYILKDYSVHCFYGSPKKGQTLEEVEKLVFEQIEKLKRGDFPDWLIQAAITDLKYNKTKELENNASRAFTMLHSFKNDISWQNVVNTTERLSKITKKDIVEFVKANYNENNYVIAYKRMGEARDVQKVEKPAITPVEVDREHTSPFVKEVTGAGVQPIQPKYVDYEKDIIKEELKPGMPLLYTRNEENLTFDLFYVFDMGTNNDKQIKTAVEAVPFLGTSRLSPAQVKEELFKLGSAFEVHTSQDQIWISLDGLSENFERSVALFEEVLSSPKLNDETLKNLVEDILKKREDAKSDKSLILRQALMNYAKYGPDNPFTYIQSEDELKKLTASDLTEKLRSLSNYKHNILYYGPQSVSEVKELLSRYHKTPQELKNVPPEMDFAEQDYGGKVFVADYPMKQVEVVMISRASAYDIKTLPVISLYNMYFGGGMSGVVFQDLRESKALAYSAYSEYIQPKKPGKNYTNFSYIGSQADKLSDALKGMSELLTTLPKAEASFNAAKEQVLQDIQSQRITKSEILFNYQNALKFGHTYDVRKDIFENVSKMSFDDVLKFQQLNIKDKPFATLVVGDKNAINLKVLEKYGTVKVLSLKDIFGY